MILTLLAACELLPAPPAETPDADCEAVHEHHPDCAPAAFCCDPLGACWYAYEDRTYPCASRWDCSVGADALIADSCDL